MAIPQATTSDTAPSSSDGATEVDSRLDALAEAVGHDFVGPELLRTALIHRSYSNERGGGENYERLEFLGDSVLGLITAHWLYRRYPERSEGELAKQKSFLVSTPVLARHAKDLGLGKLLLLGVGERRSGGHAKSSILADVLEAVLGAIYLDGGLTAGRRFVEPLLERTLAERRRFIHVDAKTALQELVQAQGWNLPIYRLVGESGPDHQKIFVVECLVRDQVAGQGEGSSKKQAEQQAAAAALDALDLP